MAGFLGPSSSEPSLYWDTPALGKAFAAQVPIDATADQQTERNDQ